VLVQEGKLSCPRWNDVVWDELVLCKREIQHALAFPHGGMMFFEMRLFLCKIKNEHALAFPHSGMIISEMQSYLCKRQI
jgi:hypothetical protein